MRIRSAAGPILGPLLLFLLAAPLAGCFSTAPLEEPVREAVTGDFLHEPSGMRFPAAVGPFTRETELVRYDEGGRNVSMGYNLLDFRRPVAATVYVYPAPRMLSLGGSPEAVGRMRRTLEERERKASIAEILRVHPGAVIVEEGPHVLQGQGAPREGWRVEFRYEQAHGPLTVPVRSWLHQFCFVEGDWIVKYRFTQPEWMEGEGEMEEFLRGLRWSIGEE